MDFACISNTFRDGSGVSMSVIGSGNCGITAVAGLERDGVQAAVR
jgi:hypothetical protein